jgi:arylsulfatase A-like enzyme
METDWAVGEILRALEESKQADNTLVIFATDNGTSPKANFAQLAAQGVHLTEHWRGNKADAYEGGHRVPLIVRWPNTVAAGKRCDEVVSLVDVMATIADVIDYQLPDDAAEDSVSLLPLLRGQTLAAPLHEAIICHSISGHFAVRQGGVGRWKALFCRGSGGWSAPTENQATKLELPPIQLYDLQSDPKETSNLQAQYPEIVSELKNTLRRYIEEGRSTPGSRQSNEGNAIHWTNVPW